MGLLTWLRGDNTVLRYGLGDPLSSSPQLASPWVGDTHLSKVSALDDIFGATVRSVTRAEAMTVPVWNDARALVCGVLARQPLVAYDATGAPGAEQPRWLQWSAYYPPRMRMVATIDDVAHHGVALWCVDRGGADASGRRPILDAAYIPRRNWTTELTGNGAFVKVTRADGRIQMIENDSDEYILFQSTEEPLLTAAADTIRGAKDLESQWTARVKNPLPLVEIRYTGDEILEPHEQRAIRSAYLDARNDTDGIVMVTPGSFEVHAHGADDVNMFIEGRNAVALDVARFWKIKASMLDAAQVNGSSIDYENNALGRSAFYDLTLRTWAFPIEERLSMDDVLPRGTHVAFDLSSLNTNPDPGTGPIRED